MDEPFSSLDQEVKIKSRQLLKKISADLQCPVLLVTHDEQDVKALASKVTQIDRGLIRKEESF